MWVGIGVGIGRNRFATGIFNDYALRVNADGGITEAGQCVDAVTGILLNASLLLIPSGYKGGKLYAEIPTNGNGDLTWTRGSDAFRTNASGVLQRVPWNLLQYSEQFDNAAWTKIATTVSTNTTTSPDGNTTADTITENTATGRHFAYGQITTVSGTVYSASIYAKNLSRRYITISLKNVTGASPLYSATFDLNNGTNTTSFSGGSPSNTSNFITSVGNGWYRIGISMQATSTSTYFEIGLSNSATPSYSEGMATYTGDGTSALYYWGAQLVEGTTAQTYLPTTDRLNFPRLSYMYGSCPAVLAEPQRTNLCLYSQNFADTSWVTLNSTRVSTTQTDPSGFSTALNVTWASGGSKYFYRTQSGLTVGTTYTLSFYIKSSNSSKFRIYSESLGFTTSNLTSTSDFARYTLTFTATVTSGTIGLQAASDNTAADLIVAFAQLEAGAYPTTYIPTTSATATRVADSFSRNNIYTNGLITSSGGTWFVSLVNNVSLTQDTSEQGISLGDNSVQFLGNQLQIRSLGGNARLIVGIRISASYTSLFSTTTDTVKLAFKWNGSTLDVFANGTKVVSATSFTATALEFLTATATGVPKFIQQMALYPEPLTDTKLIELTTL